MLWPEMLPSETRSQGEAAARARVLVGWTGRVQGRQRELVIWSDGEFREEGGGSWLDRDEILRWKRTGGGGWEDGTRLLNFRVGPQVYIASGFGVHLGPRLKSDVLG